MSTKGALSKQFISVFENQKTFLNASKIIKL